jgi:hypothetical protein
VAVLQKPGHSFPVIKAAVRVYFFTTLMVMNLSISERRKRTFFSSLMYFNAPELMSRSTVVTEILKSSAVSFLVKNSCLGMRGFYLIGMPEEKP